MLSTANIFHKDNPKVSEVFNGSKKVFVVIHPFFNAPISELPSFVYAGLYAVYKRRIRTLIRKAKSPVIVFEDGNIPRKSKSNVFYVHTGEATSIPDLKLYGPKPADAWEHVLSLLKQQGVKHIILGGSNAVYLHKSDFIGAFMAQSPQINTHMIGLTDHFKDHVLSSQCVSQAYHELFTRGKKHGIKITLGKPFEFPGNPEYWDKKLLK